MKVLVYHQVTNFYFNGAWVTKRQFEQQLKYLRENNKEVILTFDDGYESIYTNALPIMLKYNFIGIIFVISNYIGKKNDWDVNFIKPVYHLNKEQILELHKLGFIIGSHSRTHKDLTKLSDKELKEEIISSKNEIEDILGKAIEFISYPFGKYNEKVIDFTFDAGYKLAFTINTYIKEKNIIPRMEVFAFDTLSNFKAKLDNGFFYKVEVKKTKIINSISLVVTMALKRLEKFFRKY